MITKKTRIRNFKLVKEYRGHHEYLCKAIYTLGDSRVIHHINFVLKASSSIASFFDTTTPMTSRFVTLPFLPGYMFTINDVAYLQQYNNYLRLEAVRLIQRKHRIPFNSRVLYWLVASFNRDWTDEVVDIALNGTYNYEQPHM